MGELFPFDDSIPKPSARFGHHRSTAAAGTLDTNAVTRLKLEFRLAEDDDICLDVAAVDQIEQSALDALAHEAIDRYSRGKWFELTNISDQLLAGIDDVVQKSGAI